MAADEAAEQAKKEAEDATEDGVKEGAVEEAEEVETVGTLGGGLFSEGLPGPKCEPPTPSVAEK